ncbi:MAG TPA: glycosyltransferase family 4 protein [Polyangiaceae bacterium]|nr:glycosyltransferase family 4 protein [Polyangiaceae bacterium]
MRVRRLITVGHSYVVSLNRRLAHEMAVAGRDKWDVTCVAPHYFHGGNDLAPLTLHPSPEDAYSFEGVPAYLTSRVHVFSYGHKLRSLMNQKWDLVHAWEEPYVLAGWEISRWIQTGSKLVYRTAQSNPKRYPPPFSWFERSSMARACGWICSGLSVEQNLVSRKGYERPHLLSPLGVDVEAFKPDAQQRARTYAELGWSADGPPVIGFSGRLVPAKGLHLLMQALDACQEPWRALFLGAGQMELELRQWSAKYGDNVRILRVPHDSVPSYVNAMDILCAPSQTTPSWREQFGRMLVEAFACGVPVIGSNSGEIENVVGEAGVIVGENDVPGWTHAIQDLLASPRKRRELGDSGLDLARSRYTWPLIAREYLSFFETL